MLITKPTINPFETHLSPVFVAAWRVKPYEDLHRPLYLCAIDINSGHFFNARILWPDIGKNHTGSVDVELNMSGSNNVLLHGDGSSISVRGSDAMVKSYFNQWIGKVPDPQLWTFDLWESGRFFPYCMSAKHEIFDLGTLFFVHNVDYFNALVYAKKQVSKIQNAYQPGYYALVGAYMIKRFKQLIENEKGFPERRNRSKRG